MAASLALTGSFTMASAMPDSKPAPKFKLDAPSAYFDDAQSRSLLADALAGDLVRAKEAIAHGASPDAEGPKSNPYNPLRLLHYAIAAGSVPGIRTLIAVGADPQISTPGSASLPLLFAINLDKPDLLSLMLDLRAVATLSQDTKELLMFRSVTLGRPHCLEVILKHGMPIDFPDEAGQTVLMRALDAQDYELAKWLMDQGASVTIIAHDMTVAWSLQYDLDRLAPGSPTYEKVLELKQMAQQRGAHFPARSPKQRREERGSLPLPRSLPAPKFNLDAPARYFADPVTQELLAAALAGDVARASAAIAGGASPDAEGPKDNPYNHLRLLHYAIAAGSTPGIRTLLAVGADPQVDTLGSAGLPLLFAETLDEPELLSLMLDLRPVDTLAPRTKKLLMFHAVAEGRPRCLAVVMAHGVPIDFPDEAGNTVLMSAIDTQDYDLAAWLMAQGASVTLVAHDQTIAWSLEFALAKYKPGSPPYEKVLALKEMAAQRGAQFPAMSPKQRRAERAAASSNR